MKLFRKIIYILLLSTVLIILSACSEGYEKKGDIITFNEVEISVRDPKSFSIKEDGYAIDSQIAYFCGREIPDSHGPSFSVINKHYSKDRKNVYWSDSYLDGTRYYTKRSYDIDILEEVDPHTFEIMDFGYFKDRNHVYLNRSKIIFADPQTFVISSSEYCYDKKNVYWRGYSISDSDGPSFKYIEMDYAVDKARVYFQGDDFNADLPTFQYLDASYAKDKKYVYYQGKATGADISTFQYLEEGYAKDKTSVYYMGKDIGADVKSFEIDTEGARDKIHTYIYGEKQ